MAEEIMTEQESGTGQKDFEDVAPNQTIYINNLNERIKKEGRQEGCLFRDRM